VHGIHGWCGPGRRSPGYACRITRWHRWRTCTRRVTRTCPPPHQAECCLLDEVEAWRPRLVVTSSRSRQPGRRFGRESVLLRAVGSPASLSGPRRAAALRRSYGIRSAPRARELVLVTGNPRRVNLAALDVALLLQLLAVLGDGLDRDRELTIHLAEEGQQAVAGGVVKSALRRARRSRRCWRRCLVQAPGAACHSSCIAAGAA